MKCIEIMLHDDGSFMVRECEPKMEESMEGGQTFASAEEAMQAAMELLTTEGRESELEASMAAGYGSVAKKPMGAGMSAAFGEEAEY